VSETSSGCSARPRRAKSTPVRRGTSTPAKRPPVACPNCRGKRPSGSSPAWERNIRYAEKFVETGQCGQTGSNQAIAKAILEGAEPLEVLNKGFGYGYGKVSNFFKCLSDQDTDAVCIDGHAYAIWAGERITTNKTPNISKRLYQAIEEDYQSAASAVGLKPHQIQAITWLAWRRLHRVRQERDRDKGQMRFDFAS
jgi:hypothetical protein